MFAEEFLPAALDGDVRAAAARMIAGHDGLLYFFFRPARTIGAEAAASAASSAATNFARRALSMFFHSLDSRAMVFFGALPASFMARRAASVPWPERTFISFPAAAAFVASPSRSAARFVAVLARARGRRAAAFLRAGGFRAEARRLTGARRRGGAGVGSVEVSLSATFHLQELLRARYRPQKAGLFLLRGSAKSRRVSHLPQSSIPPAA